jgi:drug/metabolite transporter (DMT)-like permease
LTSNFRIWILLFIALLSVSSSAIIVRYLSEIEAIPIAFARMTIAGIILWTYSLFKPQGSLPLKIKLLTILSGVFLGIHFAFFFSSVKLTTLANATLFGTLAPIFTVILNYLIYRTKINSKIFMGLILTLLGGLTMQGFDIEFNSVGFKGDLSAIICSFWMAFVLIITKSIRKEYGTLIYSRLLYVSASVALLILILILEISVKQPNGQEIIFLLLLGFIPNILGHSILYYSIRYLPAHTVASVPLGEPVIVSTIGFILFKEIVPFSVFIGGAIIICGLYLILKNSEIEHD